MNTNELTVTLCQTYKREPLATLENLPGPGAELTPAQLRALADGLLRIAADAEAQPMGPRVYLQKRRQYRLAGAA
jgi:hypothetical protein